MAGEHVCMSSETSVEEEIPLALQMLATLLEAHGVVGSLVRGWIRPTALRDG